MTTSWLIGPLCTLTVFTGALAADTGFSHLGTLGGPWSNALEISNSSVVIGHAFDHPLGGSTVPFRWTPTSGIMQLGPSGASNSVVADLTEDGRVVGSLRPANGLESAVEYRSDGSSNDLTGGDLYRSISRAANSHGATLLWVLTTHDAPWQSAVVTPSNPNPLLNIVDEYRAIMLDLNDNGTLLGLRDEDTGVRSVVRKRNGIVTQHIPPGATGANPSFLAADDSFAMIGVGLPDSANTWWFDEPTQTLRLIEGNLGTPISVSDSNAAGALVGSERTAPYHFSGTSHAMIWPQSGSPINLDEWFSHTYPELDTSWNLLEANAINDRGQVVGAGSYFENGQYMGTRAFMLDVSSIPGVVPEPVLTITVALLLPLSGRLRRAS